MLENSYVQNSKLFELLRALDRKEAKEFGLWLQSPLHNTTPGIYALYEAIRRQRNGFARPTDKITLLRYLGQSPKSKKNLTPQEDKLLREVMHKLTVQVQDFYEWKGVKNKKYFLKRQLINVFFTKKLYKFIPQVLGKARKELDRQPFRDIQYCEDQLLMNEADFFLSMIQQNRIQNEEVQPLIDSLRQASVSKMLKYYCSALSQEKVLNIKYEYPLKEVLKKHIAGSKDKEVPAIRVYYELLRLLEDMQSKYYYALKNYLFKHFHAFNPTEIRQFLNHITNYCNWMIKQGRQEFVKEQHEIYVHGLDLKVWSAGVYFSAHQFYHIVCNALQLGKHDWADNFVANYKALLPADASRSLPLYYHALSHFYLKEYDKAQSYLMQFNFNEDFAYQLEFRILLIKIYYESNTLDLENLDEHAINYSLEALRQSVSSRNKKMSDILRQAYNNFVKAFKRILERKKKLLQKQAIPSANLQKLEADIKGFSPLIERVWLLGQVENLKG